MTDSIPFSQIGPTRDSGYEQQVEITEQDAEITPEPSVQLELIGRTKIAWLQEIAFNMTTLVIIFISGLVALISFIAKAAWLDIVIRTGVTILVLGFLGWGFNWLLGKYLVEAKIEELKEYTGPSEEHMVEISA